ARPGAHAALRPRREVLTLTAPGARPAIAGDRVGARRWVRGGHGARSRGGRWVARATPARAPRRGEGRAVGLAGGRAWRARPSLAAGGEDPSDAGGAPTTAMDQPAPGRGSGAARSPGMPIRP